MHIIHALVNNIAGDRLGLHQTRPEFSSVDVKSPAGPSPCKMNCLELSAPDGVVPLTHAVAPPEVVHVGLEALETCRRYLAGLGAVAILEAKARHCICELRSDLDIIEAHEGVTNVVRLSLCHREVEEVVELTKANLFDSVQDLLLRASAWDILDHERSHFLGNLKVSSIVRIALVTTCMKPAGICRIPGRHVVKTRRSGLLISL